jgi:Zn-dependent M32 family carboxypeptidase
LLEADYDDHAFNVKLQEVDDKNKGQRSFWNRRGIVHWDMETMMPPKAINMRSQQLAMLSKIGHKMSTDPQIGRLLE